MLSQHPRKHIRVRGLVQNEMQNKLVLTTFLYKQTKKITKLVQKNSQIHIKRPFKRHRQGTKGGL